jgi:hypothetical protein
MLPDSRKARGRVRKMSVRDRPMVSPDNTSVQTGIGESKLAEAERRQAWLQRQPVSTGSVVDDSLARMSPASARFADRLPGSAVLHVFPDTNIEFSFLNSNLFGIGRASVYFDARNIAGAGFTILAALVSASGAQL